MAISLEEQTLPVLSEHNQQYQFLTKTPHARSKQLAVMGRRLLASTVWLDLQRNKLTIEAAAENWDIPLEAVLEIQHYCENNRELIEQEAEQAKSFLIEQGISLVPKARNA